MLEQMKLKIVAVVVAGAMVPSLAAAAQPFGGRPTVSGTAPRSVPVQTLAARCTKPRTPPIPKNIGSWITADDYPALALREERGGRVTFRIVVNKIGIPARVVIQSAAYSDLGAATARALMRRARFTPATRGCVTVRSNYYGAVNWVVPV